MKDLFIDASTGESYEVETDKKSIDYWNEISNKQELAKAAEQAKREAALAKLAALGLTTDDLSALGL